MRSRMTGKISRQIKICLAALVLAVFFFTPSVCRAGNEIYVAGMPESWPFEFYDEKEETYQGVLPELLEEAGEAAGIGVKYIKPSKRTGAWIWPGTYRQMLFGHWALRKMR